MTAETAETGENGAKPVPGGDTSRQTCCATTASGRRCGAPVMLDGSGMCVFHSDSAKAKQIMANARRLGGLRHAQALQPVPLPMDLSSPAGVMEMLEAVGLATADGKLDRGRCVALTNLGAKVLAALSGQVLEARVAEIEAMLRELEADREQD